MTVSNKHTHNNIFLEELNNHFRFTVIAVLIAAALIVLFKEFLLNDKSQIQPEHFFEGFFISHLFFASLTPAALFSIYRKSFWIAVILSILTSSITCSLSDIVFPYLGGILLNYDMHFHLCIIEEPLLSWIFIIGGALIGYFLSHYIRKLSRFTHTAHILLSSLAAGIYLIAFGVEFFSLKTLLFIPILIVSVLVPCVMNDIGVPSFIVSLTAKPGEKKEMLDDLHHRHHGHHHN